MGFFDWLKKNKKDEAVESEEVLAESFSEDGEISEFGNDASDNDIANDELIENKSADNGYTNELSDNDFASDSTANAISSNDYTADSNAAEISSSDYAADSTANEIISNTFIEDSNASELSGNDLTDDATSEVGDYDSEDNALEVSPIEEPVTKLGLFARLKQGLAKTRDNIVSGMDSLFNSDEKINEDFYDELEETLILGDLGVHTTEDILDKLRSNVKSEHIKKRSDCKEFLIKTLKEIMDQGETAYKFENVPSVVFIIGVNGVGKTTSIGKLAAHLKAMNKRVMMAACDTFRAAAGSQLEEWSHRAGVELIGGVEGQDPSSVLFDAVNAAVARNVDVLLVDTAGRLHNKKNLMDELKKMNKIIDKVCGDNLNRENLIVLDASTGQNALNQAREFGEVADLTGIILTKMDGTAKGGIAIAIQAELGVPVKYIGVGEKIVDLQKFDSNSFIDALFDVDLSEMNSEAEEQ